MTTYERQQKVFDLIQKERYRQHDLGYNLDHDLLHSPKEFAEFMREYLQPNYFSQWTSAQAAEELILKATALGVAYLEAQEYRRALAS